MKTRYLSALALLTAGMAFTACSDDDNYTASTTPIITEVTTGDAVVTAVSATISNGIVKDLRSANTTFYEVGVVYSTSADPTQGGSRAVGTYSNDTVATTLQGLTTGTTYYYATYVTLKGRITKYGDVRQFTATAATATTGDATDVSATRATLAATYSGLDGLGTVEQGFKVGRSDDATSLMEGPSYTAATVEGLLPGTTYYYVPFVKVGSGYVLGQVKSFTTENQDMEYVDLGLSVMWAKCNLGAEEEQGVGTRFGYGDRTGVLYSTALTDYPAQDIADTEFDITNGVSIDGSSSMLSAMPTQAQVKELIAGTTQKAETVDGVAGVRFTAPNGNSIFLPATGYRKGTTTVADAMGHYWTGTVSSVDNAYANTLSFDADGNVKAGFSQRYLGLSLRTVRPSNEIKPNTTGSLAVGDLEGNGRIRIEIYNEFGATKSNPIISTAALKFNNRMAVTFKISGLDGNYKAGAAQSHIAGLEYADASWSPSHWSSLTGDKYDATVTGDGTYTVWMETGGEAAEGAVVFCVDIANLANDFADPAKVKAELVNIKMDY